MTGIGMARQLTRLSVCRRMVEPSFSVLSRAWSLSLHAYYTRPRRIGIGDLRLRGRRRLLQLLFVRWGLFLDPYRTTRRRVDFQTKNVKPVVVADDVVQGFIFNTASNIDLGYDHPLASLNGVSQQFSVRPNNQ